MSSLFGWVAVGVATFLLRSIVSSTRPEKKKGPRFLTSEEAPPFKPAPSRFVYPSEAAKILGVNTRTIYRMIQDGRLVEHEKNGRKAVDTHDLARMKRK